MRAVFTMVVVLFGLFGVFSTVVGISGSGRLVDLYAGVIILLLCMIAAVLIRWLPEGPTSQRKGPDEPGH